MALQIDITKDDRVFIGEDKKLQFAVYNQTGLTDAELLALIDAGTAEPLDVSAWDLIWSLRRKDKSSDPALIEKTNGSPAGITVIGTYNATQSVNTQRVQVQINDTDSWDPDASPAVALKAGTYRHSLKRLDDGLETVLVFGKFVFMQSTTR